MIDCAHPTHFEDVLSGDPVVPPRSAVSGPTPPGRAMPSSTRRPSWTTAIPPSWPGGYAALRRQAAGGERPRRLLRDRRAPRHRDLHSLARGSTRREPVENPRMRVSAKVDYALRALAELAAAPPGAGQGRAARHGAGDPAQVPREHPARAAPRRARRQPTRRRRGLWLARPAERSASPTSIRAVEGPIASVRGAGRRTSTYSGRGDAAAGRLDRASREHARGARGDLARRHRREG